jgi:hypothetical protein
LRILANHAAPHGGWALLIGAFVLGLGSMSQPMSEDEAQQFMRTGAPFALYGMFGYFLVVGAPTVKRVCAGVLLYATARTAWGFWKA